MMTGEVLYAVVDKDDVRQGGYQNTFKLFETKKGARVVFNRAIRWNRNPPYRIIKVHLEEVDTIETQKSD